ncbi:MAG: alpha/beta hydrolase [Chloroflexota bacterium]
MDWLRRNWRLAAAVLAVVALLAAAGLFGIGWYYAGEIKAGAFDIDNNPPEFNLEITVVDAETVTFRHPEEDGRWTRPGTWGLDSENAYVLAREIVDSAEGVATREWFSMGHGVPEDGDRARIDPAAYPSDPMDAHGLDYDEVTYSSPLGEFGAWLVPVDGEADDTWVIHVHGRTSNRDEALRIMPVIHDLGIPQLVIDYRNDEGSPRDPSGEYRFGVTEWEDLEGAVRYALDNGAEDVALYGYSMGGAVISSFLYESDLADRVSGAVMDAPMLDFSATVDLASSERGVPGPVTAVAKLVTTLRFGTDWEAMDYLRRSDELAAPILLFHGTEDATVPISTSEELAAQRPELVTYVPINGAGHVEGWNVARDAYERRVRDFLETVVE